MFLTITHDNVPYNFQLLIETKIYNGHYNKETISYWHRLFLNGDMIYLFVSKTEETAENVIMEYMKTHKQLEKNLIGVNNETYLPV